MVCPRLYFFVTVATKPGRGPRDSWTAITPDDSIPAFFVWEPGIAQHFALFKFLVLSLSPRRLRSHPSTHPPPNFLFYKSNFSSLQSACQASFCTHLTSSWLAFWTFHQKSWWCWQRSSNTHRTWIISRKHVVHFMPLQLTCFTNTLPRVSVWNTDLAFQ